MDECSDAPAQQEQEQEAPMLKRQAERRIAEDEARARQLRQEPDSTASRRLGGQARRVFGTPDIREGRVRRPPRHRFR